MLGARTRQRPSCSRRGAKTVSRLPREDEVRFNFLTLKSIGVPFIWFEEKIGRLACRRSENVRSSRNIRELSDALCFREFRLGRRPVQAIASACICAGSRAGTQCLSLGCSVCSGSRKQPDRRSTRRSVRDISRCRRGLIRARGCEPALNVRNDVFDASLSDYTSWEIGFVDEQRVDPGLRNLEMPSQS